MKNIAVSDMRTTALMGHTGSGKTTLLDAVLFKLGLNDRLGDVNNGSSMCDTSDEEKSRNITIFAKPFCGPYKSSGGRQAGLVLIDTPGFLDFYGQAIAGARAADSAIIVVDAASGVQVGTQRAWRCCDREGIQARAVVITGLDKDNTDYDSALQAIKGAFGNGCAPVAIPTPDLSEVVDVLAAKEVPDSVAAQVEEVKGSLVELAAETDDTLIEKFLDGQELSPDEIANGLVEAVASGGCIPVFACVGSKDFGITELLEGIVRLLPGPEHRERKTAEGEAIATGADAPFVGQVWRVVNDPFVGQMTFTRVLGGTLKADMEVQNTSRKQKEKIGSLLIVNGSKQEPADAASAGDIVAIPKLKDTHVGETLSSDAGTVCPKLDFPSPVLFQAVTAKTQADEDKIGTALQRVVEEDPTLHVVRNTETHEMVLQGLGDVHIDVAVGLMKSRSNVEVSLDTPKVPYRETVTSTGEGHYKHKKQSGGRGQYGEVYLRVEPKDPNDEEWFVDAIVGGVIPGNFIPAVQKGLVEGMTSGSMAGFPVTDVKITVYDGSYHDVDSSEVAFKIAASRALRDALSNAKPVLLEPVMSVKVMIPDQYMGDINGDLNHRRGKILPTRGQNAATRNQGIGCEEARDCLS